MYFYGYFSSVLVLLSLMLSACSLPSTAVPSALTHTETLKVTKILKAQGQSDLSADRAAVAVKNFEAVLEMDDGDDEARLGLAESYLKLGKNDQASDLFQQLILSEEYKPAVEQGMGLIALQQGNFEAAEVYLQQALEEDQSLWRSWNGLGQVYDFQKQWESSYKSYQKALKYTSKPYFVYNNMGVSYMAQKEFKRAAEFFQRALHYKSDLEIAKTNYKLALAMQHRYDEASMSEDSEDDAMALNNAGYAAMHQGKYKEAQRLFIKAIEVNPRFYKTPYQNLQILSQLTRK